MKKVVIILISLLVFFQSMGVNIADVYLLKDLLEHVQYHSEDIGDDFLMFFQKHYGDLKAEHHNNNKEEKSQHEKLPFQQNKCNHILTEIVVLDCGVLLEKPLFSYTANSHFYYQDLYSSRERDSIFQPPQIA